MEHHADSAIDMDLRNDPSEILEVISEEPVEHLDVPSARESRSDKINQECTSLIRFCEDATRQVDFIIQNDAQEHEGSKAAQALQMKAHATLLNFYSLNAYKIKEDLKSKVRDILKLKESSQDGSKSESDSGFYSSGSDEKEQRRGPNLNKQLPQSPQVLPFYWNAIGEDKTQFPKDKYVRERIDPGCGGQSDNYEGYSHRIIISRITIFFFFKRSTIACVGAH
jgi:hypothetical protein